MITQLANLPDVLLAYRVHPGSVSHRYRHRQSHYALLAQQRAIGAFLGKPITLSAVRALSHTDKAATLREAYQAATLLGELHRVYTQSMPLSTSEQRQIQRHLNKQRCYLLLKVIHIPQILAPVFGGKGLFTKFMKF